MGSGHVLMKSAGRVLTGLLKRIDRKIPWHEYSRRAKMGSRFPSNGHRVRNHEASAQKKKGNRRDQAQPWSSKRDVDDTEELRNGFTDRTEPTHVYLSTQPGVNFEISGTLGDIANCQASYGLIFGGAGCGNSLIITASRFASTAGSMIRPWRGVLPRTVADIVPFFK